MDAFAEALKENTYRPAILFYVRPAGENLLETIDTYVRKRIKAPLARSKETLWHALLIFHNCNLPPDPVTTYVGERRRRQQQKQ